ncbi:hypothetical protein CMO90_01820 [Candidatus Woesearchaeota archaeon]|nr:hypothetical protein [Candidatus Woesearchaeota archaeon]
MDIPKHKRFFAINGRKAERLSDLKNLVLNMSNKDFKHHLKGNDFSNWIKHILHKDKLADEINNINSKEKMIDLIEKHEKEDENNTQEPLKYHITRQFIYGLLLGMFVGILISELIG